MHESWFLVYIHYLMYFQGNNESCAEYSGVCVQYLFQLSNDTSLSTHMRENKSEDDMSKLINFIETNVQRINDQCAKVLIPFMCQYEFPLCDSEGDIKPLSQRECKSIQDDTCAAEWRMITTSFSTLLPVCENLGFDDYILDTSNNISEITMNPLQCHHHFKEFCGVCLPLCGKFSRYDDDSETELQQIIIVTAAMNCMGAVLVTIIAILRRKEL